MIYKNRTRRFFVLALLACATVALAGVSWIGGSDNASHAKVGKVKNPTVGGAEATPHQFPWTVGIYMVR